MTRQVDFTAPLSEEDRAYLHARGEHQRVEQMDEQFPPEVDDLVGEELEDEDDGDNYDDTKAWKVDDLSAECKRRGLSTDGKRAELIARLREDNAKSE